MTGRRTVTAPYGVILIALVQSEVGRTEVAN